MRHPPLPLATALLGAALTFLPGCESTKSSGPSPSDTQAQNPSPVRTDTASWQRARVGDRVAYSFSASRGADGGARTLAGQVVLEVVAVQQPWVWLRASFTDQAGLPLTQTRLAKELLVPVRADSTRTLDVPQQGQATAENASAAGRTWEAMRYVSDQRPVDGPLSTRVYAVQPGPLYLTRGLLEANTTLSGFGGQGNYQLELLEAREGTAGATATPPALERPLGPGAYHDRRVEVGPSPTVQRVCFAAERGFLLRAEGPVDANATPCSDFSQAEPQPLEEALLNLPIDVLTTGEWPPTGAATTATRGTFTVEGRDVPALTVQRTTNEEGTQRVSSETYAADPWAPTLSGLPYEARFQTLTEGTERVGPGGKREPEGSTRLVRWGTWLPEVRK
ncbi:putative lipoprotein [Archangium gephyra]|nr:putative lipoprotein [Archangium gephyra]